MKPLGSAKQFVIFCLALYICLSQPTKVILKDKIE